MRLGMVVTLRANATGSGGGGSSSLPDVTPFQGVVTSVPTNALQTVISRVVPLGFNMRLTGVVATGSASAEWYIFDNSTELYRTRTSGEDRGVEFTHNPIPIAAGHTIALKVVHQENSSQNFEGTLLGYDT